ncbi:MAG: polyprenyl synthetase family protein, partial [Spirochaetes bacterium]|nr:polyprenyl synthetase family protein [Spirochaetota bacterium]
MLDYFFSYTILQVMILQDYIESFKQRYNRKYLSFKEEFLSSGLSEILTNSLFYTPDSGGKLLRSIFAFRSCEIFEVPYEISENLAIALELFQSFTLIHDDLPSLDNDDFRRGKASLHRAFDTPTAILTGDALSLLTFTLFTKPFISKEFSRKLKKSTKPNSSNLNHPIFSRW